jgi:hypothetical protein
VQLTTIVHCELFFSTIILGVVLLPDFKEGSEVPMPVGNADILAI